MKTVFKTYEIKMTVVSSRIFQANFKYDVRFVKTKSQKFGACEFKLF